MYEDICLLIGVELGLFLPEIIKKGEIEHSILAVVVKRAPMVRSVKTKT